MKLIVLLDYSCPKVILLNKCNCRRPYFSNEMFSYMYIEIVERLSYTWLFVCLMVLSATYNNISVISWRSVLLVEETGGPGENHRSVTSHWQTLSHKICMFCRSLFVLLSLFLWSLCCLFFLDLRVLITPLVSSNASY